MEFRKILVLFMLFFSFTSFSQENCEKDAIPLPAPELVKTLQAVSEGLYKDIITLKVRHDGEGKISVFYENGEPKLLKLSYTNGQGTIVRQISFEELEKGEPLVYENKDKPGKAIILRRGDVFKNGNTFNFNFSVRSSMKPEKHNSFPINLNTNSNPPVPMHNLRPFKEIVLSPGISFLSWNGTFGNVEFKE